MEQAKGGVQPGITGFSTRCFGRTGAPWRDLPPDYGDWKDAFAGGDRGVWDQLLERVIEDPDFEWLMVDASHIKVHPHGTGARGGNHRPHKRGLNSKLHLAVDSHGIGRMILTEGTVADCTQAQADIPAEYLPDRTPTVVAEAEGQGIDTSRSHRKEQRYYDRALYKLGTWSRTHSWSSNGGGLPPDMPKTQRLSWQFAKSERWSSGPSYFDDTP